jgi:tRNA dimethylallyltransferase
MLIALAGPTASGKTELALQLAEQLNGEILCADSRQIYRELDIGTATPTLAEQARAPHHLFNMADPRTTLTLAEYAAAAEAAIAAIMARGKVPILVGGTGLYFRTLLYAYQIPEVAPQNALRAELQAREDASPGSLHQELAKVDPLSAQRLHAHDLRRIIRALEVYRQTGQPISALQQGSDQLQRPCLYYGLQVPKEVLYQRIQQRIQQMFADGLAEEVSQLRARYGPELPLLQTLNYLETGKYLDGAWDLATTYEQMFIHTRQYAKRQYTWFRRDSELQWQPVASAADIAALAQQIARQWQEHLSHV